MNTLAGQHETDELRQTDAAHHLHPFTNHAALAAKGVTVITRADGVYLWDSRGNRLLDGMAGLWCVQVGYGRASLAKTAHDAMSTLPYYNTFFQSTTPATTALSDKLAALAPASLNHVFFANSGSEANDTIVKMVRYFWNLAGRPDKKVIISRDHAYHGATMAAASLSGIQPMHPQADLPLPGFEHIMAPYWYTDGFDEHGRSEDKLAFGRRAAAALEARIEALGADRVAAFIGEPVQGAGGVIVPPDSYWPEIERICRRHDVLLIADEVICGFGRTGKWWGAETFGFTPDFMAMAKGLSSGYLPISATLVSDRVADALIGANQEFLHGFTYSGHPVAAAVALENIRILEDEGLVSRAETTIGPYFQDRLAALSDHPLVGEVRGVGMIAGIELAADKATRRRFDSARGVGTICREHALRHGLVMRAVGDTMVLSPPLVITEAEVDQLVKMVADALQDTLSDLHADGVVDPGR